MLTVRRSRERGYADHGWLQSYHSFSFASYYDPAHMSYSVLRVINDDQIAPAAGFGMHGHRDMEIITYMLDGELRHMDSMGNGSVIRAGDVQRMTAGSGVRHSEMNASSQTKAHLLQIWVTPDTLNLSPSYEEKHIPLSTKHNQWALVAANNDQNAALHVHQNMRLLAAVMDAGVSLPVHVARARCAYVQVARGVVEIQGERYSAGDAVKLVGLSSIEISAVDVSEVLWFDLPVISGDA